jgi:tetratricopeptide (TPR) repeat protein
VKDFFVSYNKADRAWAEWIAWELEQAGYTTILQAWDFRPGSNFVLEMQRAASDAQRTIAVLSPDYLAALFPQPEWAAAFAQDPTGEKGILVPVRVRECDVKGLLPQIVYIDLVGKDESAARQALLSGVSRERAKPHTAPAFPPTAERSVPSRPRFPGTLPPIWNIPHRRNPNFTGREELLQRLHEALTSGQHAALTQAIHGLGGVGKTQLALEYAYRRAADYDVVWWVRSEEQAILAADYAALAQPLDLPQKDMADQTVVIGAVKRWLQQNGGWLLIFDNAGAPEDVHPYLPQAAGHVIITSRNPAWSNVAHTVSVAMWKREESVTFLLERTRQDDKEAADAVASELGDLPLALEQAAAYIEATGTTIAGYLELFRSRRQDLWGRETRPLDYHDTVATTWSLAMDRVGDASPAAADRLNLCAFLAPDDIPREIINEGAEDLPEPLCASARDPVAFNDAVAALRRFSLVEASADALSVHRLVQAVARDRLDAEHKRTWAMTAVDAVNRAFPGGSGDIRTWPTCSRLLPHALAAAGHAENLAGGGPATGRLLNQAGLYLRGRAEFAQSRLAHERALAIDEAAYGPHHPSVATCVNNLGGILQELGDLEAARKHYARALEIDETAQGPEHSDVARDLNNLGRVLHDLGNLERARTHLKRALAIEEAVYGPNHPQVATCVNNLGGVLQHLGDLEGARKHYERALAIDEAAYGMNHPEVGNCVNNVGSVLQDLGDLEGAHKHYERALAIHKAGYGPNHPKVATCVNNLGRVLHDLGDLEGARKHFERALAIDEAAYGPNHPAVARVINNLGGVLRDLGDLDGARKHFERALRISRQLLGDDHRSTRLVRRNLESLEAIEKANPKKRSKRKKKPRRR